MEDPKLDKTKLFD